MVGWYVMGRASLVSVIGWEGCTWEFYLFRSGLYCCLVNQNLLKGKCIKKFQTRFTSQCVSSTKVHLVQSPCLNKVFNYFDFNRVCWKQKVFRISNYFSCFCLFPGTWVNGKLIEVYFQWAVHIVQLNESNCITRIIKG